MWSNPRPETIPVTNDFGEIGYHPIYRGQFHESNHGDGSKKGRFTGLPHSLPCLVSPNSGCLISMWEMTP